MISILVTRCRTCSSVDATWVRGRKFWRSTNRENCGENSLWRAQSDGCVFMLFKLVSFPVALLFVSVNIPYFLFTCSFCCVRPVYIESSFPLNSIRFAKV